MTWSQTETFALAGPPVQGVPGNRSTVKSYAHWNHIPARQSFTAGQQAYADAVKGGADQSVNPAPASCARYSGRAWPDSAIAERRLGIQGARSGTA